MTLFEITVVDIDDRPRDCCQGAVRSAGLGRSRAVVTADEVLDDARRRTGEYYAMIDGRWRDVIAVECPECGQARLTTATRFASRNELHTLPPLTIARAA
jgi:hypothetical protein